MEALTLPVLAIVAGAVSFSSPCRLPLLPGYLSYMSALPVADLEAAEARRTSLRAAVLFVAGFTTIFTLLGVGASLLGGLFLRNQDTVVRGFGIVIIALGLSTMGALRIVLHALAACITAGVATGAAARNIELRKVSSKVVADIDVRGLLGIDPDIRKGFSDMRVEFDVDADAEPDEIDALVAAATKYSAVYDMLANPTSVSVTMG